jgi:CheY-like chemotaxis protein
MAVILVVDNDEGIRGLVVNLLKNAGHETVTAVNGAEAVAVYRSYAKHIDLVITDINMPVMDGIQAILRMRMTTPDAKFICMTGEPDVDCPEGVVLLSKPFLAKTFLASVNELLSPSMDSPHRIRR